MRCCALARWALWLAIVIASSSALRTRRRPNTYGTLIERLKSIVVTDESITSPFAEFNVLVILPAFESHNDKFGLTIDKARPVFDIAMTDVATSGIFRAAWMNVTFRDSRFWEDATLAERWTMNTVIEARCTGRLDAIFGFSDEYSLASVAKISADFGEGIPILTTTGLNPLLGARRSYPYLIRMHGGYQQMAAAIFEFVADHDLTPKVGNVTSLNYKNLVFMYHDKKRAINKEPGSGNGDHSSNEYASSHCYFSLLTVKEFFKDHSRHFKDVWMTHAQSVPFDEELDYKRSDAREWLIKASEIANVIILCASPDTVREIMLAAHELGMAQSGEYVFINIDVSTGSHAEKPWARSNDSISPQSEENNIAQEAYRALKTISLRRSDLDEYKNFETRVKTRAESKYNYSKKTGKEYEMNNFISAFYDAVMLYAIALNETLAEGLDPRNGRNITSKMWNRTFVGITGNVSIDQNGDRYSDYSLLDLDPNQGKFVEVAYYSGASNELKQMGEFHWVGGRPPKDSPICGFDRSKCPEGYPFHVYALIGAAILIVVLAFGFFFFYRRYKLEAELAAMSWRIRWEDLDGDEVRKEQKKSQKRSRKSDLSHGEQTEALLRSNSRSSMNSDKGFQTVDEERNISSPSNSNSTKKKSSTEDDFEAKKSLSLRNRKFSMTLSVKSGGSVETIQMQNNAQIFTKTASYKGTMVALKMLEIDPKKYPKLELSRQMLMEFKKMKDLQHDHITRFAGACVDAPNYCIVTEYCPKGSLEDILENEKIRLDRMMKYSLLHDLVKGMYFLHNSEIKYHGRLKTSNCVVDSRFVLKVTDFGLGDLRAMEYVSADELTTHAYCRKLLWTAPELLRDANSDFSNMVEVFSSHKADTKYMQKADLYSFALILHEMLFRKGAFYRGEEENPEPREILENVRSHGKADDELYRPAIPEVDEEENSETTNRLVDLMVCCWGEVGEHRMDFRHIRSLVHQLNKDNETSNLVDNLLKRMEQYATNLEGLVEERTQEYLAEKKKVEELLHQLLPPTVADQLMSGHAVEPETYESVTIYFSDIVGFTALSSISTPMQVVTLLNDLYLAFDGVVDNFKVYKVETIGDAYMVVSGLPERREDHSSQIAQMSIALLQKVKNFTIKHKPNEQLKLRIGMHSGSVAAGVVGSKMPRYCLFGDTVNTASRMESTGLPLRIHVSERTKNILTKDPDFRLEYRGEVEMKGKGLQTTYWLKGYKEMNIPDFGPEYR